MTDQSEKTILKIIVAGPFSSGKTSFLESLVVPFTDLDTPTRNWRLAPYGGWIDLQEALIYMYDTSGSFRFDRVWKILPEGLIGFIVMVDSRKQETFREARSTTKFISTSLSFPYVIAANYQNDPNAWDVEALRIALRIDPDIPVVPCIATDRESVKGVLLTLLDEVLKDSEEQSPDER